MVEGGEEGEEGEGRGKGGARYLKCVWGVLGGANLVRRYLRGNKYYGEWIKGLYGPLEGLLLELPDGEFKQVSLSLFSLCFPCLFIVVIVLILPLISLSRSHKKKSKELSRPLSHYCSIFSIVLAMKLLILLRDYNFESV